MKNQERKEENEAWAAAIAFLEADPELQQQRTLP